MNIRIKCVSVLLLLTLTACGLSETVGQASPPTVLVTTPHNDQQFQQGEQITVSSTATDAQGVARVELWVDGVLVHTTGNPSPAANVPFSTQQTWTATMPGSHSLMITAYNQAGVASNPVLVNITVTTAEGAPPPPPSTAVASPPPVSPDPAFTATWTPIAVSPQDSPSPPSTPTNSPPPPTATNKPKPGDGSGGPRPPAPGPITDFESFGTWKRGDQPNGTFSQSSTQVRSGAYAGKLAYNFPSGGNDFVVFLQTYKLGGHPNQISAWVHGNGSKHYLNIWLKDAKGETWQFPLGKVTHTGWQQMNAWLDPAAPWPVGHIDGPANGILDYPIDFRALVLDDVPDSFTGSGMIYIDDLRCDETNAPPPTPTPTATTKPSPLPPSGTPSIHFWADTYTINKGDCTRLRWEVENVREVYLDDEGVVGHGKRKVCPTTTTTYVLKIVHTDSSITQQLLTIEVVTP